MSVAIKRPAVRGGQPISRSLGRCLACVSTREHAPRRMALIRTYSERIKVQPGERGGVLPPRFRLCASWAMPCGGFWWRSELLTSAHPPPIIRSPVRRLSFPRDMLSLRPAPGA